MFKKTINLALIVAFIASSVTIPQKAYAEPLLGLPEPGNMVLLSTPYQPAIIKGLTVNKNNPFQFDFIVDVGQDKLQGDVLRQEGEKQIKYFLASLAIPEKDWWVNLSPYEKDKTVPEALGQTDMGRDLLAQDYMLKQITASLIYPEKALGKTFWDKVYAKTQELYGNTQIPVNTFNKVWITADQAEVFEHGQTAIVTKSHLKVMLEEDYLATQKHQRQPGDMMEPLKGAESCPQAGCQTNERSNTIAPQGNPITQTMIRQIILPELEKEVNTGKTFANLRQIYNALILASWYKKNLKESLLTQAYADKSTVKGIDLDDKTIKEKIYSRYLQAYKKGVFNFIKEDMVNDQPIPRKYFSGGMDSGMAARPAVTFERSNVRFSDNPLVDFNVGANTGQGFGQTAADRPEENDNAMTVVPEDPRNFKPLVSGNVKDIVSTLMRLSVAQAEDFQADETDPEGLNRSFTVRAGNETAKLKLDFNKNASIDRENFIGVNNPLNALLLDRLIAQRLLTILPGPLGQLKLINQNLKAATLYAKIFAALKDINQGSALLEEKKLFAEAARLTNLLMDSMPVTKNVNVSCVLSSGNNSVTVMLDPEIAAYKNPQEIMEMMRVLFFEYALSQGLEDDLYKAVRENIKGDTKIDTVGALRQDEIDRLLIELRNGVKIAIVRNGVKNLPVSKIRDLGYSIDVIEKGAELAPEMIVLNLYHLQQFSHLKDAQNVDIDNFLLLLIAYRRSEELLRKKDLSPEDMQKARVYLQLVKYIEEKEKMAVFQRIIEGYATVKKAELAFPQQQRAVSALKDLSYAERDAFFNLLIRNTGDLRVDQAVRMNLLSGLFRLQIQVSVAFQDKGAGQLLKQRLSVMGYRVDIKTRKDRNLGVIKNVIMTDYPIPHRPEGQMYVYLNPANPINDADLDRFVFQQMMVDIVAAHGLPAGAQIADLIRLIELERSYADPDNLEQGLIAQSEPLTFEGIDLDLPKLRSIIPYLPVSALKALGWNVQTVQGWTKEKFVESLNQALFKKGPFLAMTPLDFPPEFQQDIRRIMDAVGTEFDDNRGVVRHNINPNTADVLGALISRQEGVLKDKAREILRTNPSISEREFLQELYQLSLPGEKTVLGIGGAAADAPLKVMMMLNRMWLNALLSEAIITRRSVVTFPGIFPSQNLRMYVNYDRIFDRSRVMIAFAKRGKIVDATAIEKLIEPGTEKIAQPDDVSILLVSVKGDASERDVVLLLKELLTLDTFYHLSRFAEEAIDPSKIEVKNPTIIDKVLSQLQVLLTKGDDVLKKQAQISPGKKGGTDYHFVFDGKESLLSVTEDPDSFLGKARCTFTIEPTLKKPDLTGSMGLELFLSFEELDEIKPHSILKKLLAAYADNINTRPEEEQAKARVALNNRGDRAMSTASIEYEINRENIFKIIEAWMSPGAKRLLSFTPNSSEYKRILSTDEGNVVLYYVGDKSETRGILIAFKETRGDQSVWSLSSVEAVKGDRQSFGRALVNKFVADHKEDWIEVEPLRMDDVANGQRIWVDFLKSSGFYKVTPWTYTRRPDSLTSRTDAAMLNGPIVLDLKGTVDEVSNGIRTLVSSAPKVKSLHKDFLLDDSVDQLSEWLVSKDLLPSSDLFRKLIYNVNTYLTTGFKVHSESWVAMLAQKWNISEEKLMRILRWLRSNNIQIRAVSAESLSDFFIAFITSNQRFPNLRQSFVYNFPPDLESEQKVILATSNINIMTQISTPDFIGGNMVFKAPIKGTKYFIGIQYGLAESTHGLYLALGEEKNLKDPLAGTFFRIGLDSQGDSLRINMVQGLRGAEQQINDLFPNDIGLHPGVALLYVVAALADQGNLRFGKDGFENSPSILKKIMGIRPEFIPTMKNGNPSIDIMINYERFGLRQKTDFDRWQSVEYLIKELIPSRLNNKDSKAVGIRGMMDAFHNLKPIKVNYLEDDDERRDNSLHHLVEVSDRAQNAVEYGGIDLKNTTNNIAVLKDAAGGVRMDVDPAMIARVKREGIQSLRPIIFNISPIADIWQAIGLRK